MADDQGWGDMAYYGHPHLKTPHFDQAAATGLRFDRFYAAAPVCSPTRASVMTGRHPNRMGVFKWGYPMRPQETTIAEALKMAGYTTAHFGKWHLGSVRKTSPANPGNSGFDYWLSAPNFYDNDAVLSQQGVAVQTKGESSIVAADASLQWMREKTKQDQPFLAVVWFGSPHSPHRAIAADRAPYADQPEKLQHFYGEITGMDRAFGKIRNGLTELGIRENTILWYCSDNGALPKVGSTGGHRGNKGKVYEGGLLVPAILEWPARIPQSRITKMRCNTCDIYPTLLELVGVKVKNQAPLDGVSLRLLVEGKPFERGSPMGFWDYPARGRPVRSSDLLKQLATEQKAGSERPSSEVHPGEGMIDADQVPDKQVGHAAWMEGPFKLHRLVGKDGTESYQLFNLEKDQAEKKDLAASMPAKVEKMKKGLAAWQHSVINSYRGKDY